MKKKKLFIIIFLEFVFIAGIIIVIMNHNKWEERKKISQIKPAGVKLLRLSDIKEESPPAEAEIKAD